jgi:hypothetical protein
MVLKLEMNCLRNGNEGCLKPEMVAFKPDVDSF